MTKSAIYPGSFDPVTNGHIDVANRALNLFDEVHIGVIQNPAKPAFFSLDERIRMIREVFSGTDRVFVEGFEGLLVDFAKHKNIYTIIRGLRVVSDFDFEFQLALTNRSLDPKIETVCLMTDERYSYLSSSVVRQLAQFNGNVSRFVPPAVENALQRKHRQIKKRS